MARTRSRAPTLMAGLSSKRGLAATERSLTARRQIPWLGLKAMAGPIGQVSQLCSSTSAKLSPRLYLDCWPRELSRHAPSPFIARKGVY